MTIVVADTFYFIALLSKNDEQHVRALEWTRTYSGEILTTAWVLLELADGLGPSKRRTLFSPMRKKMLSDAHYRIISLDTSLHEQGIHLYDSRPDKEWSLTDCISFVVMQGEGITEALTGDHHCKQAGFVVLLK